MNKDKDKTKSKANPALRIEALLASELKAATQLLSLSCDFDDAASVAEEKLYGPGAHERVAEPIGAFLGDKLVGLACSSNRWLRLLAVHPDFRERGIGRALLKQCELQARAHGEILRVLDQPGNYLSPGIDKRNSESIEWLLRRGYKKAATNYNLLIALEEPRVSRARLNQMIQRCAEQGYTIARQAAQRVDADARAIEEAFSSGWAFEMRRAAQLEPSGVHIATHIDSAELAAFAAHDGNNQGLGWFGPTGTLDAHRKRGLGAALLMACLVDLQEEGHSHAQVAWIGPRDFYEKVAGVASDRTFTVMTKDLSL